MIDWRVLRVTNISRGEAHQVGIATGPDWDAAWLDAERRGLLRLFKTYRLEPVGER